jgi:AraC family chitin signaling transcriptional activator
LIQIKYICFLLISTLSISMSAAQELPPVNNFLPKEYSAEAQNWSISQSKEGNLYVANNLGLLEFNGAKWELYKTPNATIIRSVKIIEDKIFTGFYMDFGYWLKNDFGKLYFTSLVSKYNIPVIEDEQFWNIIQLDDWILFQSLQRIYFFNIKTKEYKVISSEVKITKMFSVRNTIYFQKFGKGLYKVDNGKAKLVSDHKLFKEVNIINIHQKRNSLLLLTNTKGFVELEKGNLKFWKEVNKNLRSKNIYNSIQLKDGGFALGTISNGVVFLNENGDLSYTISQKNGLINNTVLSLYETKNGVVWLGLDKGVSSVNVTSEIKIFKEKEGKIGSVYATTHFNNDLYLGTNQGLFVKKYNSNDSFKIITGTEGQVWSLNIIGDKLFCGHDAGTFIIDKRNIINKINIQGTWDVKQISEDKIIQGNYTGLYLLEKNNGKWRLKNKIKGFNNSSRSFEIINKNQIFVNHEYKGIFKLKVDTDFKKIIETHKDTIVGKGLHSNIIKYRGKIYYSDQKGVFEYSNTKDVFLKDSLLSSIYSDDYTTGKLVYDEKKDILWSFSKKYISYVKPNSINQKLNIRKIPISEELREGAQGFENLSIFNDDEILGIDNGYILLNINNIETRSVSYSITINSIKKNQLDKLPENVVLKNKGIFTDRENNLDFRYNVPFLTKDINVEYQFKLKGYTSSWSKWSTKPNATFENLPRGIDYTFYVKAKIGNEPTMNTATYNFRIENPWFLTKAAIISYIVIVLLILLLIDRIYKTYYRTQRKRLLEKQEKDFKLISLAAEKELMQAKNDQLNIDFASKSRELATSTMSIIKKNELLSSIKSELIVGSDKGVKSVIKIINKNLNNTDDWQVFKEAFNNADKDFIKKLKLLHISLTPNDLRLCAYLRLNLASKEIAPLLNISPRSVEVKRYRLRKKMNLEHNDSLTDYILNI